MSYVDLPPEATFTRLTQVIRNQRRLMFQSVAVTMVLFGSVVASVAAML
jgi:hypothetical protein